MSSAVAPKALASRSCSENFFPTWDGQRLFYRAWLSDASVPKAIVLFHRGHEHSGRFQELVDSLELDDFSVFAWDARGHGRSPGERGYAESFSYFVRDADTFVRFLSREYGIPCENMAVIAHSVGAVVAATWVHDYAPRIRSLVLASPALRVKLYIPFALLFLRLLNVVKKKAFIQSYVKAAVLTHDPEQRVSYQQDPLITRAIAVNILIGMHDASTRIMADASAIRMPTLVLASGKDWVVKIPEQRRFLAEFHLYPDFFHDLFHERERRVPIGHSREFILRCFEQPYSPPVVREANRELYERLAQPLPAWSPRSWFWGAQRLFLKTIGRLSNGIRVGWQSGFDSGATLDYVYRNSARGYSPLGRMIDRIYLSSPGWTGIRQRRVHLEQILAATIERLQREGRPVRILDVAAGHGRYVLETMQRLEHIPISAVLRDMAPRNIEAGRELAVSLGLSVDFQKGDAFDGAELAAIRPAPSVGIVSGLYELFSDNAMVLRSLRGIRDAMREGGYLIYTNQPWHPQLEMIARTLDNREGKRWVMRCRAQAELDELVRQAGFEKIEMLTDEDGIFTVSLAQRLE